MKDRVKALRDKLEMSQGEFGKKINLSQRAISNIETGISGLSDRNVAAICRVFNVNEEWLRYGEGEMFNEPQDGLAKLQEEYNLNEGDMALLKSFLELPPEMREAVLEFGRNFAKKMSAQLGVKNPLERPPDDELTVAEKRRIVNEELDAEEKRRISSPSTGISGSKKNKSFS